MDHPLSFDHCMKVIKRDGRQEKVSFDKILKRIETLCESLQLSRINAVEVAKDTINGLFDGITTEEIDHYAAVNCSEKIRDDPQYDTLAAALCISRLHKMTNHKFIKVTRKLYNNYDKFGTHNPLVTDDYFNFVQKNIEVIQSNINYQRDYDFDYFGYKTLERAYLHKAKPKPKLTDTNNNDDHSEGNIVERPQHLLMRVALGINQDNIDEAIETYNNLSNRYFIFGSPTLFNAGSKWSQMSSCFLLKMGDNIEHIYDTIKEVALISKRAGGIGISMSDIRASGSLIRGTNGISNGPIPFIQELNWTGRAVNQGGRRNGAIACFCKDIEVFTANEGVKKIQDVKIGDLVVTHKNRLRPVVQTHKNLLGDRKIYKLQVSRNKDIYVTGNHKFWSFYTKKCKSDKLSLGWNSIEELKNLMNNETIKQTCYVSIPCGTEIEDLKNYKIDVMDYENVIVTNVMTKLKGLDSSNKIVTDSKTIGTSKSINRIWHITEDLAIFFGMWLIDGDIKKSKTHGKIKGIGITVRKDNEKKISFIHKVCKETFDSCISEHTTKTGNVVQITINSRIAGLIFVELFGSYFDGKKLPNMIFNWPKNLVNSLVAGLITSNGHITNKKYSANLALSNKKLINDIYHLCKNNRINVSFAEYKIGNMCNCYTISIPLNKDIINQTNKFYNDERIERCRKELETCDNTENDTFLKIIDIVEVDRKDEYVYTLGVEEDHSYTVEGLIVENCYIEPWHGDIFHFCELRSNKGKEEERARDIFLALWIPDLFMKRVHEDGIWSLMCPDECPGLTKSYGEEFEKLYLQYEKSGRYKKQIKAIDLWFHILSCQIETGMPYMLFKDNVNKQSNHQNLGVIQSSNLCVKGDTKIFTKQGYHNINQLVNQTLDIWNGQEWSQVNVVQTGVDQELVKVKLSNGSKIKCTPYHKFYISNNDIITPIEAKSLSQNDILIDFDLPVINGENSIQYPYAEGYFYNGNSKIRNKNLLQYFKYQQCTFINKGSKNYYKIELGYNLTKEIPNNVKVNDKIWWFEGYSDANGTVLDQTLLIYVQNKKIGTQIKLMLQTLGCDTVVRKTSTHYHLIIDSYYITHLRNIGFSPKMVDIGSIPNTTQKQKIKVMQVGKLEKNEDTFCFTENKRHMGMFNGVLTGQCSEIVEYTDVNEIAVCNLSSICLPRFIEKNGNGELFFNYEKLAYIAGIATKSLNKIIDINYYPVEKAKKSNFRHRPIGIGIQGLADVYCILSIPYDSDEARIVNKKIFETIYYGSLKMSVELAKQYGPYDSFWINGGSPFSKGKLQFHLWGLSEKDLIMHFDWEGLIKDIKEYGTRNSLLTTVMPTASTSQIMGNTECLVSGTPVATSQGLSIPIEQLQNEKVFGWDKSVELSNCVRLIDQGLKETVEITFEDGKQIQCTKDHQFLTEDLVWKEAKDLNNLRVITSFDPPIDESESDEKNYTIQELGHDNGFNYSDRKRILGLARILGYVCVSKVKYDKLRQTMNLYAEYKYDAMGILEDIDNICGYDFNIVFKNNRYKIKLPHKLTQIISTINSNTDCNRIPSFILKDSCPKSFIREFLAGYFGGLVINLSLNNVSENICKFKDYTNNNQSLEKLLTRLSIDNSIHTYTDCNCILVNGKQFATRIGLRYNINISLKLSAAKSYWRKDQKISPQEYFENTSSLRWFTSSNIVDCTAVELPYFLLKVVNIQEKGLSQVWDISVDKTHSFLANGVMVHNCYEPITTNVYTRSTLAGEFTVINKYLIEKLIELGLWNEDVKNELLYDNGSVQKIDCIPQKIKDIFKTAYEIKNKPIVMQAIERGPFIDQSQSLNLFCKTPDFEMLTSSHFYTWRNKLKTGLYYLRTQPAVAPMEFGLDAETILEIESRRNISKNNSILNKNQKNGDIKSQFNCDSCSA
jgi:ribonucleotide reductase alpha subunit